MVSRCAGQCTKHIVQYGCSLMLWTVFNRPHVTYETCFFGISNLALTDFIESVIQYNFYNLILIYNKNYLSNS